MCMCVVCMRVYMCIYGGGDSTKNGILHATQELRSIAPLLHNFFTNVCET